MDLSDCLLKISVDIYNKVCNELQKYVTKEFDIDLVFQNSSVLGRTNYDNNFKAVQIFISNDKCLNNLVNNKYISDFNFLQFINATYHECCHVNQSLNLWNKNRLMAEDTALSFVAEDFNDVYEHYYWNFINEIDAELYGLTKTYDYLKNNFSNQADEVMLDFINEICKNPNYCLTKFGSGHYDSIDDLFLDINNCCDKSQNLYIKDDISFDSLSKKENDNLKKLTTMKDKALYLAHLSFEKGLSNKNNFPCLKHRNIKREIRQLHLDKLPMPDFGYDADLKFKENDEYD